MSIFKKHTKKKKESRQFKKKDIPKLRYGILHSRFGYPDGVSIVMKQVEGVLNKNLSVPKKHIFYLVGRSKEKSSRIWEKEILWDDSPIENLIKLKFTDGFGGGTSERVEKAISEAQNIISNFVKKNKIDVIIAHNSSHPVNFIYAVALSRYYRDCRKQGRQVPKYLLWWHDSHLERKEFAAPAKDVENYLLQGIPGSFVEHIIFINTMQFNDAKKYFKQLDKRNKGFYKQIQSNHDVIYNTTDLAIKSLKDLESSKLTDRLKRFIQDFKIKELLNKNKLELNETLFCLQHTRLVNRKRIDFALTYCYELLKELKKKKKYKALYFLISGHSADKTRKKLIKLNKELRKKYNSEKVFLVFAEDFYTKTDLVFEEYPQVFAKLDGISTYFSEIEGFGNNLLEVLGSGLTTVVYTYPVFRKDISKYKFRIIEFDKFEITKEKIQESVNLIENRKQKLANIKENLRILKKHFPHKIIASHLVKAIISKRLEITQIFKQNY